MLLQTPHLLQDFVLLTSFKFIDRNYPCITVWKKLFYFLPSAQYYYENDIKNIVKGSLQNFTWMRLQCNIKIHLVTNIISGLIFISLLYLVYNAAIF